MTRRPGPGSRSAYRMFRAIATRWSDNDIYGHMNNVIHYSLFDTAINGCLIDRGLLDIAHSAQICMVVETGCRYHSELAYPDLVTAGIRVAHLGASSVRYEIGLFRNDDDLAAAEGYFVHVNVDRLGHKPTPFAEATRTFLESLVVEDPTLRPAGDG